MPYIYKNLHNSFPLLKLEDIHAKFPNANAKARTYFRQFHINRIEDFRRYVPEQQLPYRKPVHDFLFLTEGSTIRSKGLDTCEVTANTFFFVPAYQIRMAGGMSADAKGFFCHFDMDIFKNGFIQNDMLNAFPFLQYVGNPVVQVPEMALPNMLNLLERLETEYQNETPNDFSLFSTYLLALFLELKRFSNLNPINKNAATLLTQRYKEALMQHVYDIHDVKDFAEHLGVNQNYLNRCLHTTVGKTAHNLLNEMLILEAKTLLKQTDLTISEIAYKVCKKDHSDFSRFFKSYTGLTPKEFRG